MSSSVRLYVHKILTVLLAGILLLVTIGLASFTLLLLPYKLLVCLLAKLFRPDLDSMVTGAVNVCFTLGTPERPIANICVLMVMEGATDFQKGLDLFQTRILNYQEKGVFVYKRLKQSVSAFMGYPFLRTDENFDLKNHFRTYDYTDGGLAFPNPARVTQQELEERLPALLLQPWKRDQSNWEFLLINNYCKNEQDMEKHTVIAFRMNHTIGDGYSTKRLLFRLFDPQEPSSKFKHNSSKEKDKKALMDKLKMCAAFPFKLFYDTAELAIRDLLGPKSGWASVGERQLAVSALGSGIPVDDIKAIKNELGASYTSVLLAAVCAALGKFVPGGSRNSSSRKIGCIVPMPKPNHPATMTNHL